MLNLNELSLVSAAIETLCNELDCSVDELLSLIEGQLLSEEECNQIKNSLKD